MSADPWLTEMYFDWLVSEAFSSRDNRREYSGCLRQLHDIPFLWTLLSDEDRSGDALSFRQSEFLGYQTDLDSLDQVWLGIWATATPSVLEVLLGVARRWSYYFGGDVSYYFGHLFRNMEYDRYPGRYLGPARVESLRERTMTWITRQFQPNGQGSPFPINVAHQFADDILVTTMPDMRHVDIWSQMNAYSYEHFQ